MWKLVLVFLVFLGGCSEDTERRIEASSDLSEEDLVDVPPDLEPETPDMPPDLPDSDEMGPEEEPRVEWAAATLTSGDVVKGEVVGSYNQNLWWDVAERLQVALFRADRFASYPNDQSIRIVSSDEVVSWAVEEAPEGTVSFEAFQEARNIHVMRSPLAEPSYLITADEGYHREEDGFGDYAWDMVVSNASGALFEGEGGENEDYHAWEVPVFAPHGGWVIEVERFAPDNVPGEVPEFSSQVKNNLVGIALGGHYYLYLLHFKEGSIPPEISVDEYIWPGDYLGTIGNSGVTLAPHLHMVLLWFDPVAQRSWSLPISWRDLYMAPTPAGPVRFEERVRPGSGQWVSSEIF